MKPKPFEIIVEFTPQSTKTGITYEAHKKGSLIRCKDCYFYGTFQRKHYCTKYDHTVKRDGFCAWAEPKVTE